MSKEKRPFLSRLLHWELLVWGGFSSVYLLRFMVLGSRINEKYHDTTVLITEQINIQLRICEICARGGNQRECIEESRSQIVAYACCFPSMR
jgi:hypothetical protein